MGAPGSGSSHPVAAHPVAAHYGGGEREDLAGAILDLAARASGKSVDILDVEDLGPFDEFHIGGREATYRLVGGSGFRAGDRILDLGCGIGGPARLLAAETGCHVTGLDLTPAFCRAARRLTRHVGLGRQVDILEGDALALPFAAESFDGAWMIHAVMNIPDKAALYAGLARVVKPGGRFAVYEIHQGEGGGVRFPVPWAEDPALSHLIPPEAWRGHLEAAGFAVEDWSDMTAQGVAWFEKTVAAIEAAREAGRPPPAGGRLVMGESFPEKAANLLANLRERRVAVVMAHCRRR